MGLIAAPGDQVPVPVDLQEPLEIGEAPILAHPVAAPGSDPARAGTFEERECGSHYWDAQSMAPLNARSAAAIARLRAYKPPPFPLWDRLPISRRAAVLMLLYADRRGDLRLVITMRAASLRSFSGHAALPGGKADSLEETPYQIARREAFEEIGLPHDANLPPPFRIEHLCYLPMNLARTELIVRPCVAFLHTTPSPAPVPTSAITTTSTPTTTTGDTLIPRLDAKEVAAVFSAPLYNFLKATDLSPPPTPKNRQKRQVDVKMQQEGYKSEWYHGSWAEWHGKPWRVHYFYVPVHDQRVAKPEVRRGGLAALDENGVTGDEEEGEELEDQQRYKVWGMTARIIVDAARIAYDEKPEIECNDEYGDEELIMKMEKMVLMEKKKGSAI